MSFDNVIHGTLGLQFEETTVQHHTLGVQMLFEDGRRFRYVKAGASLTAANLVQSEVRTADWNSENPTAAAARFATSVTVDVATAPSEDDFKDGWLIDETNGHTYLLSANTAADPTVLTLAGGYGLETDLETGDLVSMFKSSYLDVVLKTAARADAPVIGVAPQTIANNSFGWVQSAGICCCLVEDVLIIGDRVVASPVSDAGACSASTTDLGLDFGIGVCLEIGSNATNGTILLTID